MPGTYFWDHSRFMPDWVENACSISCCSGDRVGTGLEEGVGAGMAKALWISSGLAFRTNSSSFTMHSLWDKKHFRQLDSQPQLPNIVSVLTFDTFIILDRFFQCLQSSLPHSWSRFIIYAPSHRNRVWGQMPNTLELYILPQLRTVLFPVDLQDRTMK